MSTGALCCIETFIERTHTYIHTYKYLCDTDESDVITVRSSGVCRSHETGEYPCETLGHNTTVDGVLWGSASLTDTAGCDVIPNRFNNRCDDGDYKTKEGRGVEFRITILA